MEAMEIDSVQTNYRLPWIEKYRPSQLEDICSHTEIIRTLKKWITTNQLPHMLFYGPPGTGKTTSILAVAKELYTDQQRPSMVLELNASDDRGINVVREEIVTFAQTKGLHRFAQTGSSVNKTNVKLIILDEADAMTKDAQNALRRVIEKHTENVRFCIICNYLSNIIPAIQSRCTRFRFAPLPPEMISPRIDHVVDSEKVDLSEDGKGALMDLAGGDMRSIINVLQTSSMAFSRVDAAAVYKTVGQPSPKEMKKLLQILLNENFAECSYQIEKDFMLEGYALSDIITRLHDLVFEMKIPSQVTSHLIAALAELELRLSVGCSDKLQLAGLIAAFIKARKMIREAADGD